MQAERSAEAFDFERRGARPQRRLRSESRSTEARRRKRSVRRKRSTLSGATRGAKRRLRLEPRLDKTRRRKRSRRRATPNRETPSAISKLKRQNALAQAVAQRQNLLQLRDDARLLRQRGKWERHFCQGCTCYLSKRCSCGFVVEILFKT